MQVRRIAWIVAFGLASAGLGACSEQGPAERAGEAVDEAIEDVGEGLEDAADEAEEKAKELKEQALGE